MASGKRSAAGPDPGAAAGRGYRRAAAVLAVLALLSASAAVALGIAMRAPSFEAALRSIDAAIARGSRAVLGAAFVHGYRTASSAGDWLSLLKRARSAEAAGDLGRYVEAAERALLAERKSEPVAAAAAHALLRGGKSEEAFALFAPGPKGRAARLSPDRRPGLWAEAFLKARGAREATIADYGRLAAVLGEGGPFLGAAVLSVAAGDVAGGRYWILKAMSGGAVAPYALMWDCGLYDELSELPEPRADSEGLALLGDASWKARDTELAKARWERSISLGPLRSWKPYASLALASGSGTEESRSYWERLRAAFLSGPKGELRDGALGAYASELAREGKDAEALRLLGTGSASESGEGAILVLVTSIRGKSGPEERVAAEYAALQAMRPRDAVVLDARLRLLAERGFAEELAQAYDTASRLGPEPTYGWFYGAWALAARGRIAEAAQLLAREGSEESGPAAAFALGTLRSAQGRAADASSLFERAAAAAQDGRTRAAALKAKGRALTESGDSAGAAAAFKAAAIADPDDAEAAVLARSASTR